MENLKYSIITPTYNSEKTIRRTIESILNQSYKYIEYVIVDGVSSDNTLDIIKSYEEKFIKKGYTYKFISERDNGIADAFNKGIDLATGDIVGIVNSDDWLEPDAVKQINYKVDEKHILYCGDLNLYENGNFVKKRKSRPALLWFGMYIMHPTAFIKKEIYQKYKFDTTLKIAMDYDLILRIRKEHRLKFKYIPRVISNMELGGASSDINKAKQEDAVVQMRYFSGVRWILIQVVKKIVKLFY